MSTMVDEDQIEQLMNEKFISKEKFSEDIERYASENHLNYMDSIIQYCDENDIELETVGRLVSKPLKDKIKYEATQLNYLTATTKARLPI